MRDALKAEARKNTSAGNRVLAEEMDARPAGGLTASSTNPGVNAAMEAAGKGGKVMLIIGAAVSATNILTAPAGTRGRAGAVADAGRDRP